jgi:exodeoxyribonuclease-3
MAKGLLVNYMQKKRLKIISWNVNSINARLENIIRFIQEYSPDVLLLQEIKSESHKIQKEILEDLGYNVALSGQKSYNGVAILSKYRMEDITIKSFRGAENDARYIESLIDFDGKYVRVASVYVPNGQAISSEKFLNKLSFIDDLHQYLKSMRDDEVFLIGGDFNVAPTEMDLYDPIKFRNSLGFSDVERKLINSIINYGFNDTFRHIHPTKQIFSWWDYRDRYSFKGNRGWRIDYILSSNCEVIIDAGIIGVTREWERPSDHAPVFCDVVFCD